MSTAKKAPATKAATASSTRSGRATSTKATPERAAAKPAAKATAKVTAAKSVAKVAAGKPTTSDAKAAKAAKAPAERPTSGAGRAPGKDRAPAKRAPSSRSTTPAKTKAAPYAGDTKFLEEQRGLLLSERAVYQEQAKDLKAEADSLAQEREPGDVQFDEESGEGGTVTVDRERDLALSAQALQAVAEIDAALGRIEAGTYGVCERCQQPIPKPRLRALPYARLCVACKSGGLSRR